MIRRILLASASFVALTGAASAADMYVAPAPGGYKDGPSYVGVNWAGFYAGVNGGYGWGAESKVLDLAENPITSAVIAQTSSSFTPEGGFGGGQIGYNWQPLGSGGYKDGPALSHLVLGIEADIQGAGISGDATASLSPGLISAHGSSSLDWFGTVRGRIGYACDRALIYGTGGFAYGGIQDKISKVDVGGFGSLSESKVATGYVVGGGVEYSLSAAWSVKAEYQFIDLGKDSLSVDVALPTKYVGELDANHSYNTVRLGVNYHVLPGYEPLK
jgi:outer membrane immunogenic protein